MRQQLLSLGMRLEVWTIIWTLAISASTITSGVLAGSALLLAVGAGTGADMLGSFLLFWRLRLELQGDSTAHYHLLEHRTARIMGSILILTAGYVLSISIYKFSHHAAPTDSYFGIGISMMAALVMPFLARSKMRVARELESRALNAEAVGTLVGGLMAAVVLIGLVANSLLHWWWIDSVGAVLLVPMLLKEARDAWLSEPPSRSPEGE